MTFLERLGLALADAVLVVHAAFIAFVVVGLALIWVGRIRGWRFVRNWAFRAAHLAAIGVVVAESLAGVVCPLTTWENRLRWLAGEGQRYEGSFLEHWLHRVIFFEADERVFTAVYVAFLLAVAATLWLVPPRRSRPGRGRSGRGWESARRQAGNTNGFR
jgi:hypothetical protein